MSPDPEVMPLYVMEPAETRSRLPSDGPPSATVVDRRRLRVAPGNTASFATYFNAFPAAYWQRWTTVGEVELVVQVAGQATVTLWRSDVRGQRSVVRREGTQGGVVRFTVSLSTFIDGGWSWFDVTAGPVEVLVEHAEWTTRATDGASPGSITIGVTTLNRAQYVLDLLTSIADEPTVLDALDEILIVDQGDQLVRAQAGFPGVEARLGGRLRVLEQPNLGGSGGFARSMLETLSAGRSRYLLLMDDDVAVEPESVLRAQAFADLAERPLLVGGHMFNLYERSCLHSFAESIYQDRYEWGPAQGTETDHDFADQGLAATPWMHRRFDVDYNAWWSCLIPVEVLQAVGLSAPYFIAWDDAEFGIRAASAGYPTVSLPGVAIWHMPFTTKADASDWKTYFEQRNRLVTALVHRSQAGASLVVGGSLRQLLRHLLAMQYAAAELHLAALEDLLKGPDGLHSGLLTKLPEVRSLRSRHEDGLVTQNLHGFSSVGDRVLGRTAAVPQSPVRRLRLLLAARGVLQQVLPTTPAGNGPQALLPNAQAVWWRLALLDSALVWTRDGTGVRLYERDRAVFARLLLRTVRAHGRLLLGWGGLRHRYRAAWPQLTSRITWERSLAEAGALPHGLA